MEKKLYRSTKDKKLCGVCGGIAEYVNVDPTVLRLLWALLCCVGAGILAYIIAAIIMPEQPAEEPVNAEVASNAQSAGANTSETSSENNNTPSGNTPESI